MYDGDDVLGEFGTLDNNLRYVGANPSNYIYFNCSTTNLAEMNDSTCEKWRIVGLFNNIEDANGKKESRVKIVSDSSLGKYSWDTSDSSVNYGSGINQWGNTDSYEGSDLMRELNNDYLGNITVGTDGKWYNGRNNLKKEPMPSNMLNINAQSMILDVKWNNGSMDEYAYSTGYTFNTYKMYSFERSNNISKACLNGSIYCNDSVERTISWIGKIALIYPSDYGYSMSGNNLISRSDCIKGVLWSFPDSRKYCRDTTWLYGVDNYWTLTSNPRVDTNSWVIDLERNGECHGVSTSYNLDVRPSLFLKNSVKIIGGSGSLKNPYKLAI